MAGTANPPATIEGGGTNLSEYRALLQVFVYASQKSHEAADVVHDALVGGVVATFFDRQRRFQNGVFLPSSKSIATMAPLIAEGFYSPSLSYTLDNPFSTPYQPLSESYGRDLFTLVVLLFPDCFLEGPPDEGSLHANSLSLSVPLTPQAVPRSAPYSSSPSIHRESTPLVPLALATAGARVSPGSTYREVAAHPNPPSLSATYTNVQGLTPGAILPYAEAELNQLHRHRLQVAMQYLAGINDTLRDVQVRQLKNARGAAPETDRPPPAETVHLRVVQALMETLKVMLLCCVSASEMAYYEALRGGRPLSGEGCDDDSREELVRGAGSVPLSPMHLLEQLTSQCDAFQNLSWANPVESWNWGRSGKEMEEWYDRALEHVNGVFVKHRQCNLETFLFTLKEEALREQGRVITHAPEILMHRATDGHRGVTLEFRPSQVHFKPKLPSLPIQNGEAQLLLPISRLKMHPIPGDSYVEFLFDAVPSPLITALNRWRQKKLTDSQLREESNSFFSTPWRDTSEQLRRMIQNYVLSDDFISRIADKNPVLLARIALWSREDVGNEPESSQAPSNVDIKDRTSSTLDNNCKPPFNLSSIISNEVLSSSTFAVSTAHFIRELVARRALDKAIFMAWTERQCIGFQKNSTPFPMQKTFLALVDFVLIQASWELEPALAAVIQDLRTGVK